MCDLATIYNFKASAQILLEMRPVFKPEHLTEYVQYVNDTLSVSDLHALHQRPPTVYITCAHLSRKPPPHDMSVWIQHIYIYSIIKGT